MESRIIEFGNMKFIGFEPGKFIMGKIKNDRYSTNLEGNREIRITKKFYIQSTPVNVEQYRLFLEETKYNCDYFIEIWNGEDWVRGPHFMDINATDANYPVVGVSYNDAMCYAEWLSDKFKLKFRLPTEAEFEYAAKDGCNCTEDCAQALIVKQNHLTREENEKPYSKSREIGKGIITKSGLYDMHGLIWQWCEDWFFYYSSLEILDPKGPIERPEYAPWKGQKWESGKVIRGGSFNYPFYHSRCSNRHYSKVNDRNYNVGFRLCLDDMKITKV